MRGSSTVLACTTFLALNACVAPVAFGPDSLIGWAEPEDAVTTVADTLVPFDVNRHDLRGPKGSTTGKTPEIVVVPEHHDLYVFAHDYGSPNADFWQPVGARILKLRRTEDDYIVTRVIEPPGFLDRILGFGRRNSDGALFTASAVVEFDRVNAEYPEFPEYRDGIVHVSRLDALGEEVFRTDLDLARGEYGEEPEQLINPMVAATGRLAVGGGHIAVVHGINTQPDPNIGNDRHQKALTTYLDAETGEIARLSGIWVSHSFDQRLFWDGDAFVEHHLGDAYPRHIAFARTDLTADARPSEYPLLHIKGEQGANVTRTSIGSVVPLPEDDTAAYLAAYVTERTSTLEPISENHRIVSGSRELAITRVLRGFEDMDREEDVHLDPSLPDVHTIDAGETRLRWLTDYQADSEGLTHAERPRLVDVGEGRFVVLWEEWRLNPGGGSEEYETTWGMVIDAQGETLVEARAIANIHLPRGDDAFALPGRAGWVTGDSEARSLTVHTVDGELQYRAFLVE